MITIGSCACTATKDVGSKVVNLFTVLVTDDRSTSGTGISSKHDTILYIFWLIHFAKRDFKAQEEHLSVEF